MKKYIQIIITIFLIYIFFSCSINKNNDKINNNTQDIQNIVDNINDITKNQDKKIIFIYGVFYTSDQIYPIIKKYEQINPDIKIIYKKIDYKKYNDFIIDEIKAGRGPDIFMVHTNYIDIFKEYLIPLNDVLSPEKIKNEFVPVAYKASVKNGITYAIPNNVDTLAVFFNPRMTNNPPKTWHQMEKYISQYININQEKSYTSFGHKNVDFFTDIILSIYKQNKGYLYNENKQLNINNNPKFKNTISYYKIFDKLIEKNYPDIKNKNNLEQFINEKIAVYFGYSFHYKYIKEHSIQFNLKVAYYPQMDITNTPTYYASFWMFGGNKNTKYTNEVKDFLKFLAEKEQILKFHTLTGLPVSRKDLISITETELETGIWAKQLQYADIFEFNKDDYKYISQYILNILNE